VLTRRWLIPILLGALLVGCLLYGVYMGDALYVLKNARAYCYT